MTAMHKRIKHLVLQRASTRSLLRIELPAAMTVEEAELFVERHFPQWELLYATTSEVKQREGY